MPEFHPCFGTVGYMTGRSFVWWKTCTTIPIVSVLEQVVEETEGEKDNPDSSWNLNSFKMDMVFALPL